MSVEAQIIVHPGEVIYPGVPYTREIRQILLAAPELLENEARLRVHASTSDSLVVVLEGKGHKKIPWSDNVQRMETHPSDPEPLKNGWEGLVKFLRDKGVKKVKVCGRFLRYDSKNDSQGCVGETAKRLARYFDVEIDNDLSVMG